MPVILPFEKPGARRLEVFIVGDDSLTEIGLTAGEEAAVSLGEFQPGGYHLVDVRGRWLTLRTHVRPPNLIGWVVPPSFRAPSTLDDLPAEGMLFNTDRDGNIVELDDGLIERCWGVEAGSCYGFGFIQNVAPEYRARFMAKWAEAILVGGVCSVRTVAQRVDGLRIPLVVTAVPHRNGISERFNGLSGVTQAGKIWRVA